MAVIDAEYNIASSGRALIIWTSCNNTITNILLIFLGDSNDALIQLKYMLQFQNLMLGVDLLSNFMVITHITITFVRIDYRSSCSKYTLWAWREEFDELFRLYDMRIVNSSPLATLILMSKLEYVALSLCCTTQVTVLVFLESVLQYPFNCNWHKWSFSFFR